MYIADLHIHSKYSRATSGNCDAPHLDQWARYKGIDLVGTGDFTHPVWRQELREALEPAEDGLYRLRREYALPAQVAGESEPRFVLSGEISTIYKKNGKTRKVHHVILLPGLEAAEELSHRLEAIGNLHSDGRPILGLDSRDLLEITMEACPEAVFIPAHIWTPHFSLFGAFSCFETVEECYGDMSGYIHALETGLSSDPPMNRRVSMLDGYTLVSNSDAHSPAKLGREANLIDGKLDYPAMKRAIETGENFLGTIEFFPEEGKYHLDGHRGCACCLEPSQTAALDGRCPVCGRKLTVGVLHRVEELADRAEPIPCVKPFESLMPLPELLANCMGVGPDSKKVQAVYFDMLKRYGNEFFILRELPVETVERDMGFAMAEALRRLREGKVCRQAGYDGEYGKITVFQPRELELLSGQTTLLDMAITPKQKAASNIAPAAAGEQKPQSAPSTKLNDRQQRAVEADAPVVAVIAGPGTGKTKTLVERIAYLIEVKGVSPSEITAVTFTRQAAREMEERLKARLHDVAGLKNLTVGTFHGIAMSLLPPMPLIGREQAKALAKDALEAMGEKCSPVNALGMISACKNGLNPAHMINGLTEAYEARLKALHMRDLDDLLLHALEIDVSGQKRFHYLLVDEFQDINPIQRRLTEHWSEHGRSLFVIGDPDQSIYGFRGADAACFRRLEENHPGMAQITLQENYRSVPSVLNAALAVIAHNDGAERTLRPNRPEGAAVRVMTVGDTFSEGVFIAKEIARMTGGVDMLSAHAQKEQRSLTRAFSEIAVLCRTHRQLEQIEYCLTHDDIPCVICGREDFWEDSKVQGLLGFYRSLLNPRDTAGLDDALRSLWKCPQALCQRAEAAMGTLPEADPSALRQMLKDFEMLTPWLDAVEELLPSLHKQKPRKQLEALGALTGVQSRAMDKLLNAAVFYTRMEDFLRDVLLGEEGDLRRRSGAAEQSGAVRLMTLHGAKGLEFPVVFLAGVTKGDLPLERADGDVAMDEERRLFFVGMTRAKEELIISCGGEGSPFLDELPPAIKRQVIRSRQPAVRVEQLRLF